MPNHSSVSAARVEKGTAPVLRWPHTKKFRARNTPATRPGKASAVRSVTPRRPVPAQALYARAEA